MELVVDVIEARGLRTRDPNELCSPYVKLQLGGQKSKKVTKKSRVATKNLNPFWDEQFTFMVGDLLPTEKLVIAVLDVIEDKVLGQLKMPLMNVLDTDNLSLETTWYELQPKMKKSKNRVCGEIRLGIYLSQKNSSDGMSVGCEPSMDGSVFSMDHSYDMNEIHSSSSSCDMESSALLENVDSKKTWSVNESDKLASEEKPANVVPLVDIFRQFLVRKNMESLQAMPPIDADPHQECFDDVLVPSRESCDSQADDACSNLPFEELVKMMESKDEGGDMPQNLPGGVLIDKSYSTSPFEMNSLLFSPSSEFFQTLAEVQGTTGIEAEPWRPENDNGGKLKRVVTYTKAATKLVKALRATEEQTYLKADGKSYAVLASVNTPDAPFASCYRTEILYCIMPGPELQSDEQSSRLLISWRMNFIQSTMMKGMIENGAKQGLTDGYRMFADKLSEYVKVVDLAESSNCSKEQILASLQVEQESIWKLAFRLFGNFPFLFGALLGTYIVMHILVANGSKVEGLEFFGIDLPDSIGEIVVSGLLILHGQHVWNRIGSALYARKQGGKDHGIKAQGDGWLLTVALIEGSSLSTVDAAEPLDTYVVFTCNGKSRTSSIKLHTTHPQWNEIFEFDATSDPPSRMEVVVYNFNGPFDEPTTLGSSEVNFVKSNLSDLADVWILLQGKYTQTCQPKLHLRVFLDNSRGNEVITEYLTKMEKEVGKKMNMRSLQTNSAFQKLFGLPPEEFLINDYACYLKRKMPLQGRLFLSPRIIGFNANIFGMKTKFFLLWEDIDDIQVIPPSLASVGSPSLMIFLRKGRGAEARHGAKALERDGRLKFHFQSFAYNEANRTIMALWKARSLSPEQKIKIAEESEIGGGSLRVEESGSSVCVEDAKMSEIFSSTISVSANSLLEIYEGGDLERKLMKKIGFFDYSPAPWQPIKTDLHQRQINYKFDKGLYGYGGEVISTQQRACSSDKNKWVIEDTLTPQGVIFSDHFNLQLKYQVESLPSKTTCNVQVFLGIAWIKSTKHQKKITKSVMSHAAVRLKEIFHQAEKELAQKKQPENLRIER